MLLAGCAPAGKVVPQVPAADQPPAAEQPPSPAAPAAPVVGRDGRMVVAAMEYPWSAIGRVNTGGRGFCTGVLIGPRLVLTAAQCLFDAVTGRWWGIPDVYFVAGYERDRYVIHSGVRGYEVAPDFVPGSVNTLANLASNWALLTLAEPLGYDAGWLAVQWQDDATRARLANGDGLLLAAGYRRGWGNAVTVDLACAERACAGSAVEAALPTFVYLDEEFRVLGNPLLRASALAGAVATPDFARVQRGDEYWGESLPPGADAAAAELPRNTIARLLRHLGHLTQAGEAAGSTATATAILEFETVDGLPRTGMPSVALLGHLLEAARRELPSAGLGAQAAAR
jgi:hypothetical protein